MRTAFAAFAFALLLASSPCAQAQKQLYKHVDKDGKVYYTDRPVEAGQKAMDMPAPNVASPDARRQLYQEEIDNRREEYLQRNAAIRRQQVIQQRDRIERMQQQQQFYRDHPEERPRQIQVVPSYNQ